MSVFIILNLCLSYVAESASPFQNLLTSPWVIYVGVAFAVISIIGTFFKKLPDSIGYDLFASSALLTWFADWKPFFTEDSPMFFFFPLYFALAAAFASLILIGQKHQIDRQTIDYMRAFVEKSGMEPWILMILVLGSLELKHHFMLFPVLMTLLLVRYTLAGCLRLR